MQNDGRIMKPMVSIVVPTFLCQEINRTRLKPETSVGVMGIFYKIFQQSAAKTQALTWNLRPERRNLTQVIRTAEVVRQQAVKS